MQQDTPGASAVVQSNIEVHTRMADAYQREEPHYRPENKAKVKANLLRVAERTGRGGCSTSAVAPAS